MDLTEREHRENRGRFSFLNSYLLHASAAKLLITLILSLIIVESLVMVILENFFSHLPVALEAMVDCLLLLVFLFPPLYLLVFRPLALQIDRLKQTDVSLRESENTIMALMNSFSESAFLFEADGTIMTLNVTAASRLGGERELMIGNCLFDYFPPDVAASRRLKVDEVIRIGQNSRFQDKRDGRHYDISMSPIFNRVGEVIKLALFAIDTTIYHDAEQQLKANALALERSNNEVRLLGRMSETLQSCRNLEEAYDVLTKFANQLFPEESGALYILESERNLLQLVSFWGEFWSTVDSISPEDCWGMRRGRMHSFRDPMVDVQCSHLGESGDYHYYCLPLMARSETLGMLHLRMAILSESEGGQSAQELKEHLLVSMGEHMALAIANLRLRNQLHNLSTRDALTGVYNRRFMEESLFREILQAERSRRSIGIIMLDIDFFKRFNDTYGHEVGDLLLVEVGRFLREQVRGGDIVCRYGGEEFIVIMPGAGEQDTETRAERLRLGIHAITLPQLPAPQARISASLGVAVYPVDGADGQRVLKSADNALYQAKHAGRDRVCRATPLPDGDTAMPLPEVDGRDGWPLSINMES